MNTVIRIDGETTSSCNLCNDSITSKLKHSFQLTSGCMTVRDYEMLICDGYRRAGKYFYTLIMYKTCCPGYSARLSVNLFSGIRNMLPQLSIQTSRPNFTIEKLELYLKYQLSNVGYKSYMSEQYFRDFFVSSPLYGYVSETATPTSTRESIVNGGTFHQEYRFDGRLIGLGVIDILRESLSSVCYFYDPEFTCIDIDLARYSANQEIQFCKDLNLKYYYMGLYAHNNPKFAFKVEEFGNVELFCPIAMEWINFKDCKRNLDSSKFSPLNRKHPGNVDDKGVLSMYAMEKDVECQFFDKLSDRRINAFRNNNEFKEAIKSLKFAHKDVIIDYSHIPNELREKITEKMEEVVNFVSITFLSNVTIQLV